MKRKKITVLAMTLVIILCVAASAFGEERIGQPYVDLGYPNPNSIDNMISLVSYGSTPSDFLCIEVTESGWVPIWKEIDLDRYWFDGANKIQESFMGIFSDPGNILLKILILLANLVFAVSVFIVRISIEILILGFNSVIISNFAQEVLALTSQMWFGDGQTEGFRNTLLLLALLFGSFYFVFKFIQLRYMDTIRAILFTVLILGLSAAYFANTDRILNTACNIVDTLSGVVFNIMPGTDDIPIKDPQHRGLIKFSSYIWETLVIVPWAQTQFGTTNTEELKLTGEEKVKLRNELSTKVASEIYHVDRVDQILLALPPGSGDRQVAVEIFQDEAIDHGQHPQTVVTLSSMQAVTSFLVAILSFVGAAVVTIFCVFIGFFLIYAETVVIFCLFVAPFIAIAALVPESGWGIATNWLKALTSSLFAKIFYGIYAGSVFLIIGILYSSDAPFFLKMLLTLFILIGALFYRKTVLSLATSAISSNNSMVLPNTGSFKNYLSNKLKYKMIAHTVKGTILKNRFKNSQGTTSGKPKGNPGSSKTTPGGSSKGNPGGSKTTPGGFSKGNPGGSKDTQTNTPDEKLKKYSIVGQRKNKSTDKKQTPNKSTHQQNSNPKANQGSGKKYRHSPKNYQPDSKRAPVNKTKKHKSNTKFDGQPAASKGPGKRINKPTQKTGRIKLNPRRKFKPGHFKKI